MGEATVSFFKKIREHQPGLMNLLFHQASQIDLKYQRKEILNQLKKFEKKSLTYCKRTATRTHIFFRNFLPSVIITYVCLRYVYVLKTLFFKFDL